MDKREIENAVERLDLYRAQETKEELDSDIQTLLSLAQLFLSVKGMPLKIEIPETRIATPLCEISFNKGRIQGRNQAIDLCTAHLAGKVEGIEGAIHSKILGLYPEDEKKIAQAIKEYLLDEEEK